MILWLFCKGCATEFKTHYTMKVTTYYDRPTCVFGAVDTPNGRAIADEMLAWITPEYNTHVVWHDGRMFEYHALRYAQELAIREDIPVLYLHTKGACNKPERSALIRKMWRQEFGYDQARYFAQALHTEKPLVLCPFIGPDRIHRYNGFVANAAAWKAIPLIQPNENRMVFEHLWRWASEVEMVGTIYNDITSENLGKIHEYLRKNY